MNRLRPIRSARTVRGRAASDRAARDAMVDRVAAAHQLERIDAMELAGQLATERAAAARLLVGLMATVAIAGIDARLWLRVGRDGLTRGSWIHSVPPMPDTDTALLGELLHIGELLERDRSYAVILTAPDSPPVWVPRSRQGYVRQYAAEHGVRFSRVKDGRELPALLGLDGGRS